MEDHEHYRRVLEESGRYRVLKRFTPQKRYCHPGGGAAVRKAAFVDVETTGLDIFRDAVIELAVVLFSYTLEGQVVAIIDEYAGLDDPGVPIPPRVTQLTGITDEMVRGKRLDTATLARMFGEAHLIIAHNAAFDRPFVERRLQLFGKPWACSQREVPWREHGVESTKLEYLAYRYGLFYDGHRALDDCRIAVHLLAQALPGGDVTALAALLEQARKPSYRVWAIGSPYEAKDLLKARRYRWDVDKRSWWKEVGADELEAEVIFLCDEVLAGGKPDIETVTAYERYCAP